ncbi:ribosome maturation factor RimM [Piscinibacter sp. HJYY11]|uniref:ribosome maturation factor RimM n=1 Tax=Piscinibacter sp. HJYY11 TaxID=2801333 RepID=UPI00191F3416|nr:ribosome maturation factor RimM [Piscinibacter sp. HJYY11]MBL0730823.1 ribosome maturation factor RimM [Piscinibacter sp. HJYY11]
MASAAPPVGTPADWPEDAVEVGRIVDAWGVKGWIKVQPFASDPQALFSSKRWYLQPPEDSAVKRPAAAKPAAAFPSLLKITQAKDHGDVVVAQVQEVEDRSAAEALRGGRIFIARSSFPTADADEYYWVDLIGMAVVNRKGEALGTVVGLIDTGPHSVLRIQPADAKAEERLVPFVSAYVDEVKTADKLITVDWGLDY